MAVKLCAGWQIDMRQLRAISYLEYFAKLGTALV